MIKTALAETAAIAAKHVSDTLTQNRENSRELIITTVHHTLTQLGVDSGDPLEMQRDFQHLREWRRAGEDIRSKAGLALITLIVGGIVSLLVIGFKHWA